MAENLPVITIENQTVEVIRIRKDWEWAVFTIQDKPGEHRLAIDSSYGGFVYTWTNIGSDFYTFLANLYSDYAAGKMVQGEGLEFDAEATQEALLRHLQEMRDAGECTAVEFENEAEAISGIDSEYEYALWSDDTTLFEDQHELICTSPGSRHREFLSLHKIFWPDFSQVMKDKAAA